VALKKRVFSSKKPAAISLSFFEGAMAIFLLLGRDQAGVT